MGLSAAPFEENYSKDVSNGARIRAFRGKRRAKTDHWITGIVHFAACNSSTCIYFESCRMLSESVECCFQMMENFFMENSWRCNRRSCLYLNLTHWMETIRFLPTITPTVPLHLELMKWVSAFCLHIRGKKLHERTPSWRKGYFRQYISIMTWRICYLEKKADSTFRTTAPTSFWYYNIYWRQDHYSSAPMKSNTFNSKTPRPNYISAQNSVHFPLSLNK